MTYTAKFILAGLSILLFCICPPSLGYSQHSIQDEINFDALISQNSIASEHLWAFAVEYHSSDSTKREKILENTGNNRLTSSIDSNSTKNTILNLAFEFADEKMLFIYLLNEISEESRDKNLKSFYSINHTKSELKEINKQLIINEKLSLSDKIFSKYPTLFFYLAEYTQTLKVVDSSIFDYIINFKEGEYSETNLTPIENELFLAALFYAYYNENQFQPIIDIYSDLINFRLFPVSYSKRNLFWSLDYVMYQTGNIDKSLEVQRKFTIPLTEYLEDKAALYSIYSSHGGNLYTLGKYREARDVFQQVLKGADDLDDQNLTRLYNNLSLVYYKTGESAKYVETQLKALEHAQSYENYRHQIDIYRNLHVFYRKNQNTTLALSYIDRAAELAESISNKNDLIYIYISKAVFERNTGDDASQALKLLNEAEQLVDENTPSLSVIRILSEKADILNSQGNLAESIEMQNRIIEIGKEQSDPSVFLEAIIEVAGLEIKRQNYGNAKTLLAQFKNHDISVVDFSVLTMAQIIEAKLAREDKDFTRAERRYQETTDLVMERARYSADSETGYWTVESEYLELFESYADFLIERGKNEEAVQLLDRVKTINDASMLQNPLITSRQLTEEQLAKDRQLTLEMESLRRKAFSATGDEKLTLNNRIELLQAKKRELHRQDRSLTSIDTSNPIWSVQRSLSSNEMLLHVTGVKNNYYISEISPSSVSVEKLEITAEIKELFESAIKSMITGRTDLEKLYQVGQAIGIDNLPSAVTSIIMMADGYLHQLPLDVIPIEKPDAPFSYGSVKYLVEVIDTRNLNHLGELFIRDSIEREFEQDFSGFGVSDFQNSATGRNLISLPSAPDEIKSISNNLTRFTHKQEFTESGATPQTFRKAAGNSRILHMATHSEISDSDPLFSRIHLVPNVNSDDQTNQIFAYELFDLNLNNELIMLNSCESGGDRSIQGSGIMGISRALHYAGAQSLILNAWSVNDQFAAEFANIFYTHINAGETKSRALQLAKIDFIRNSNSNPHFWGPYILNGNNEPLIQKRGANLGNVLVALIFIAGFLIVSRSRKKAA